MGKFYVHKDGKLAWTGVCPDGEEELQALPGYSVGLGEPPPDLLVDDYVPPPSVEVKRRREYPPIGDQLDAIWKVIDSLGTDMKDAKDMLAKIREVKLKYPKMPNNR